MFPTIRRKSVPSFWDAGSDFDKFFNIAMSGAPSLSGWSPAVDVRENEESFVVTAELPGLEPEHVDLSVENGVLSISGEKKDEFEGTDSETGGHLVERRYGKFQRNFSLPRSVDPEKVEARFRNGILTVTLPKSSAAKPRRIKIG